MATLFPTLLIVLDPKEHWRGITTLEDEIHELQSDPQLALDMDGEKNAKVEDRRKRIEEREIAHRQREEACPPVKFEGTITKVEYRDVKIEDDDGEKITIPGTVLTIKIPGSTVEELNKIRTAIDDYAIRLTPINA